VPKRRSSYWSRRRTKPLWPTRSTAVPLGVRVAQPDGSAVGTLISVLEQDGYEGCFSIEMLNAKLWRLPTNEAHEDAFLEQAIAVDEIFSWARTCRWEKDFGG
jgi:hypothetical protein